MERDYAFICDYADASQKLNALGIGFDQLYAERVPVVHPLMFFCAQLRASVAEIGEKTVAIRAIGEDGQAIAQIGIFSARKNSARAPSRGRALCV